jgi:hypothetical protein
MQRKYHSRGCNRPATMKEFSLKMCVDYSNYNIKTFMQDM